jgi:hypothetical protein
MSIAIKIDKQWDSSSGQQFRDDSGSVWSVADLIDESKDLPVMNIPMEHMCLSGEIGTGSIRSFVSHMKMVNDADLKYPIILCEDGNIMDGRHRLAKALLLGKKTIKAVRFTKDPPPTFTK